MKFKSYILAAFILLLCSCATYQPGLYYYGKYSNTLYDFKKSPTEEQLQIHIDQLNDIIKVSNKKNLRVPPGIYAELGFYYSQQGNYEEAINLYKLETATYPESLKFMNTLIQSAESLKPSS